MNTQQAQELARNLIRLAKEFNSADGGQAAEIKRAFKAVSSKNDLVRTTVYLMEVVGVRDMQYNQMAAENTDLKELLKLNNISLDGEDNNAKTESAPEQNTAATPAGDNGQLPTVGSEQVAATAGLQTENSAVSTTGA